MLNRRKLLSGAALSAAVAALGGRAAFAFSSEPMPKPVATAFALACKPAGGAPADHSQLIAAVQSILKGRIAAGVAPAGVEQVVVCPICGCRIVVTADASY
jgi:hypothetical protein